MIFPTPPPPPPPPIVIVWSIDLAEVVETKVRGFKLKPDPHPSARRKRKR